VLILLVVGFFVLMVVLLLQPPSHPYDDAESVRLQIGGRETKGLVKAIPPQKKRKYIGRLLEEEGLKTGVELGVQKGDFAKVSIFHPT